MEQDGHNTEDGESVSDKDPRSTVRFWYDWLKDARDGEKPKAHRLRADAAYRDWECASVAVNGEIKEYAAGFGIYYSYVKHLAAEYYSKTPESNSIRRFGIDDPLANTMALITERMGEGFLSERGFDDTVKKAVQDFIHADKACLQVVSEDDEPEILYEPVMLMAGPNGPVAFNSKQEQVPPEEVVQGEDGRPYQKVVEQNPKIYLLPVGYDEIVHSPNADVELQMKEKGYCITLDEYEVKERFFGENKNTELDFDGLPWIQKKNDEDDPEDEPTKRLKIWEIYCDDSKKVYWLTDKQTGDFLDVRDNDDELLTRFPSTPFITSNTPKKGMYPTPVHTHVKPYMDALDLLWERIVELIPKVERKAILDEKLAEAIEALEENQDWVTVKNLAQMIEGSGDLRAMIQFLPLKELVEAIREASQLIDFITQIFNEHAGLPDVLRGQADPQNAAQTNQMMGQAAHSRFKMDKAAVQQMVADGIALEVDMALKKWSDRKIWQFAGFDFAEPEHQQRFPEALKKLRNDKERFIRVGIKTDTTTFADEAREFQKAQALSNLITNGLATIGGAQNVEFIPVLVEMLLRGVDALGGSEEHEDDIRASVEAIIKKKQGAQQGQEGQQDPAAMAKAQESQTKLQVAQMEAQVDMAQANMDMQQHQAEMPLKQAEIQLKIAEANLEREKIQLEYAKLGQEKQITDMELMETAAKTAGTIQKEHLDTEQAQIDLAGKVATATSQNLKHTTPPATPDGGLFSG